MKIKELLGGLELEPSSFPDMEIKGLTLDSREVAKDFLFLAVKGKKTDGKKYIREAAEKGAAAALSDERISDCSLPVFYTPKMAETLALISKKFYKNPSSRLNLIGLTGTKGKTTTSYVLESALNFLGAKTGVIGTVNYRTHKKILSKASNTTPLAPVLWKLLSDMTCDGCSHCVMEVSSHALALKRADGLDFDSALFTNLQSDHMDFHRTKEAYLAAKTHLFELLAASPKKKKTAVLNADEEASASLSKLVGNRAEILTYGFSGKAQIRAGEIESLIDGTVFELFFKDKSLRRLRTNLIGRHNIYNILAATALLHSYGFTPEETAEALGKIENVPGRLEKIVSSKKFAIYVDYAHTEDSLKSALTALMSLPHERLITVFGCGGDRDRIKRAPMGAAACSLSNAVIITSDNPRTEEPFRIIDEILEGVKNKFTNYEIEPDREKAIAKAISMASEGDIILIAGKGHEDYQILNTGTIHFSDMETARKHLKLAGKE